MRKNEKRSSAKLTIMRTLRERRGITQRQLAAEVNFPKSTICIWERYGLVAPAARDKLELVAVALCENEAEKNSFMRGMLRQRNLTKSGRARRLKPRKASRKPRTVKVFLKNVHKAPTTKLAAQAFTAKVDAVLGTRRTPPYPDGFFFIRED